MIWRGEQGIALVITLLVMTLLLVMGSAFMSISSTETLIAINERNRMQAFHLAEAGADRAIAELGADENYPGIGETGLGPGTYRIDVCPPTCAGPPPGSPDQRLITATGCVRDCATFSRAMAQVEVLAQRSSPFRWAAGALSLVEITDRVVVDSYDSAQGPYGGPNVGAEATIGSNGNITLGADATVNGDAHAGGSVTIGVGSNITGGYTEGTPKVNVEADPAYPACSPIVGGVDPPGAYNGATCDLTVGAGGTVTLDPGTYAFNEITIGEGANLDMTGPVVIYMTGNFSAQSGAKINASAASTRNPTKLLILSSAAGENAIKFYWGALGGGEFYGAIYALDAEVEFERGGWEVYGAIVANEVDLEDDARFHYDLALAQQATPADKFRPIAGSWREVFAP
ncbi:MAG: PilX N-terminal domain-containing pilus assembly protein [Candidatus Methylomirabilales bacterium]